MQGNALATPPMSMNMAGWAAMGETGAAGGWTGRESQGSEPSSPPLGGTIQEGGTMGSQLGSLAGWQAIAEDVIPCLYPYLFIYCDDDTFGVEGLENLGF
jgi:hypothetical protein